MGNKIWITPLMIRKNEQGMELAGNSRGISVRG